MSEPSSQITVLKIVKVLAGKLLYFYLDVSVILTVKLISRLTDKKHKTNVTVVKDLKEIHPLQNT